MTDPAFRHEHDLLGQRDIPTSAYFGIHTLRATENFRVTGTTIGTQQPHLITAVAHVKCAAARANHSLGLLNSVRAEAISATCGEIVAGKWHDQFVVDPFQGGAGTSVNMNANEVIANRAIELLGGARGDYSIVHPNDHVNLSQSTNDVYPTAIKVGLVLASRPLLTSMADLAVALSEKASELSDVPKLGRTQLQDAVPMTFGQEFAAFAALVSDDVDRLQDSLSRLTEINLGGTAIGTGLNAPAGYAAQACTLLAENSGVPVRLATDPIASTSDAGGFVDLSGGLRRTAIRLSKMSNDLRLLASGPVGGFGEITLPPVQAGSSIMPGKVNPVIPELMNQIAFDVMGGDATIGLAAEAGQLQLNAFEPLIAHRLFTALSLLEAGCRALRDRCISGITANIATAATSLHASNGLLTALGPRLGYETASALASEIALSGLPLRQILRTQGLMTEQEIEALSVAVVGR